jgi:hypothetical protein
MKRRMLVAVVAATALGTSACGSTYVDESLVTTTTASSATATTSTIVVATTVELDAALIRIADAMNELSDAVVDDDARAQELLGEIDAEWAAVAPIIRSDYAADLFGYEQVVALAHSSVERRRPADASKGWKVLIDLNAAVIGA